MDSSTFWYLLLPLGLVLIGAAFFLGMWARKQHPQAQLQRARDLFEQHRPQLQQAFFEAASTSGKPRGLRWRDCQWETLIEWTRDRQSGQFLVLVGITISFEAIEGGDMEGVEAVGNLRNASAVFFLQDGRWQTAGHAIFNLNPDEAVARYGQRYERLS